MSFYAEFDAGEDHRHARDAETARYAKIERPNSMQISRHQDAMRNFASALTQLEAGKMFGVNGVAATLADA